MIKIFDTEKKFVFDVVGYEIQGSDDYYDLNWLNIKIEVADEFYSWSAADCCLLTVELKELRDWFKSIEEGLNFELSMKFIEPEIRFEYLPKKEILSIFFHYNFHPKGGALDYGEEGKGGDDAYQIQFGVKKSKVQGIVSSLDKLTATFPVRSA